MVQCVALGCKERPVKGNKGCFPKEHVTRKNWIIAVNSRREIGGKVVDFKPSNASRLCLNHFEDSCCVHPPSVMDSVGMELKLMLKAGLFQPFFLKQRYT
ncbi:hypothetical protein DPMN_020449 [Dreissena polymorpha]|uniref:THAP-type domain-containing protein n=1 Tax=Dreissena polymorpha TaxID=45954 RepID=A0A9D4NM60_DREPO|nr:hypothetical protein DPMN_020449 [Dreissena polymorpha]